MIPNFVGGILGMLVIIVVAVALTIAIVSIVLSTQHSCPHCRTMKSKKAPICPHCGKPVLDTI
jgi:hypothetical protein